MIFEILQSTILFLLYRYHAPTSTVTPYSANKQTQLIRYDEGLTLETSDFKLTTVAYFTLSTHFMVPNYLCSLSHFHEIHLYTCSCTMPGYCYTQHSHHSCVFRQHIRPSLENEKKNLLYGTCFYFVILCFVVLLFSRLFALVDFWDVIVSYFILIFSLPRSRVTPYSAYKQTHNPQFPHLL